MSQHDHNYIKKYERLIHEVESSRYRSQYRQDMQSILQQYYQKIIANSAEPDIYFDMLRSMINTLLSLPPERMPISRIKRALCLLCCCAKLSNAQNNDIESQMTEAAEDKQFKDSLLPLLTQQANETKLHVLSNNNDVLMAEIKQLKQQNQQLNYENHLLRANLRSARQQNDELQVALYNMSVSSSCQYSDISIEGAENKHEPSFDRDHICVQNSILLIQKDDLEDHHQVLDAQNKRLKAMRCSLQQTRSQQSPQSTPLMSSGLSVKDGYGATYRNLS